jgi:hypothetical protein
VPAGHTQQGPEPLAPGENEVPQHLHDLARQLVPGGCLALAVEEGRQVRVDLSADSSQVELSTGPHVSISGLSDIKRITRH